MIAYSHGLKIIIIVFEIGTGAFTRRELGGLS